jgi:Tfp pilus assembly protein PilF
VHLHNLAAVDQARGRAEEAEQQYRQALALKEQLLGPDHPEVGLVANNLGTLLCEQQRDTEAAGFYRRALVIAERCYPPEHPATMAIRHNLSRIG